MSSTSWWGSLIRLPAETQKALQQLACLGNSADFAMLRWFTRTPSEEMHGQLWEAVRTGLIFRSEDSYRFLHDRVQEAAYSLIPGELRAEAHLRIGMLMAAHTSADKLEESIFEIANQLNRGSDLITSTAEHRAHRGIESDRGQAREDFDGVRLGAQISPRRTRIC